jgi:hypothetical protein
MTVQAVYIRCMCRNFTEALGWDRASHHSPAPFASTNFLCQL